MSKRKQIRIDLGYEVGNGRPVTFGLAHTFVTGQTQVSGKTTTLKAIVERSGCRALAFVTKRGETMGGRSIRPYLPREGDAEIHWRYVETIMASAVNQKGLRYERLQIIAATKGAKSLEGVRANVERLRLKHKSDKVAGVYELLGAYLDLVLPELRALKASPTLDLVVGLNVMDLTGVSPDMQALCIGAAIARVNDHEEGVLVVFPEAWQFAPRDRNTAAKFEAEKMARMGAAIGNFLLSDSQDITGVSPVLRQASTVWIVGRQMEGNELKRTLGVVKSVAGVAPKPEQVTTLDIGQFFVCADRRAVKAYVRPAWMSEADARDAAVDPTYVPGSPPELPAQDDEDDGCPVGDPDCLAGNGDRHDACEAPEPTPEPAESPAESEPDMTTLNEINDKLDRLLKSGPADTRPTSGGGAAVDVDALYDQFKARLLAEPAVLRVLAEKPELHVKLERKAIDVDGTTLVGRVALLVRCGFLDKAKTNGEIVNELGRIGGKTIAPRVSEALGKLKGLGFVTDEGTGWRAVENMKRSITEGK